MPMRGRLSRRSGEDYLLVGAQKLDIEPSGNAVHVRCERCGEVEWNFYALQLHVADATKIEQMGNWAVQKKRWIECIDNRLGEVRL